MKEGPAGEDLTEHHVKCTTQFVQIAARRHRYLLNPQTTDLYIAGIVIRNTRNSNSEFSDIQ